MQRHRSRALWAALLLPAALSAASDVSTEGTLTFGAGGTLLDGDRPAYQQIQQQRKDGFAGIEELRFSRESKDSLFQLRARLLPGNEDYRLSLRYERPEKFYVDTGFEQFRVWYDGSGGYFRPTDTGFHLASRGPR